MSDYIPKDMQMLILDKLSSPRDHARSSVVCKMWYSIYKKRTFPWFVLSDHDKENHTRGFFSLYDQKVYRLCAPELGGKFICGSSHGWLITVSWAYDISLYDPFSKVGIKLAPAPEGEMEYLFAKRGDGCAIKKIILSCDPRTNPEECVILCAYLRGLMYCRVGDKKWTFIPRMPDKNPDSIEDLIFHKGNFLVLYDERVVICHLASGSDSKPSLTVFCPDVPLLDTDFGYLASIEGNVVALGKNIIPSKFIIPSKKKEVPFGAQFDAYKLDEDNMTGWRKENDIGAHVLFLGCNESRALPASSFPNSYGNYIYYGNGHFMPRYQRGYLDRGIFNLKDYKTVLYYQADDFDDSTFSPPLWLIQN